MSKLTDVETELRKIAEYTKEPAPHASRVCELAADIVHNAGWNDMERRGWEDWARELTQALKERDEARADLAEETKFHHRTHAELVQVQCDLQDAIREREAALEVAK